MKMNHSIIKKEPVVTLFVTSRKRFKNSRATAACLLFLLDNIIFLGTYSQHLLQHCSTEFASLKASLMTITVVFIIASPFLMLLFSLYSLMGYRAFAKLLFLYGASQRFLLMTSMRIFLLLLLPCFFISALYTLLSFFTAIQIDLPWFWMCGILFFISYLLILIVGSIILYCIARLHCRVFSE